jgi:hypothetical protein
MADIKPQLLTKYRSAGFTSLSKSGVNFLYKQLKWRMEYDQRSIPSPWKTYWVDPDNIDYIIYWGDLRESLGKVPNYDIQNGDWDLRKEKFEDTYMYQSLVDRFVHKKPWEETHYFSIIEDLNKNPNSYYNVFNRNELINVEDPMKYLSQYDRIFRDIKNDGYREDNEKIIVNIGRNGEYMRHDGAHRITMAKILDINTIPVQVNLRHKRWQQIRDKVARSDSESELPENIQQYLDHSDLQDLLKY